jgi:hypothetical protein
MQLMITDDSLTLSPYMHWGTRVHKNTRASRFAAYLQLFQTALRVCRPRWLSACFVMRVSILVLYTAAFESLCCDAYALKIVLWNRSRALHAKKKSADTRTHLNIAQDRKRQVQFIPLKLGAYNVERQRLIDAPQQAFVLKCLFRYILPSCALALGYYVLPHAWFLRILVCLDFLLNGCKLFS